MKNKRSNKYKFYKLLSFVLIIVSIILTGELLYLDLLPTKYISIIIGFIVIFDLFSILLLNSRRLKAKVRKVLTFLVVIVIFGMSVLNFYFGKTLEVLIGNGDSKYRIENYSIIVLNNSKMENLKDIKNEEVGYYES